MKFRFSGLQWCLATMLCAVMAGCEYHPKETQEKYLVVATTGMIADGLTNILPADFKVYPLMGPGVDPHLYEPKPSDIRSLANAEVVVYNGLHLEGKMAELFSKLKNEKGVFAVAEGINNSKLISIDEHSHDPHIWLDPFIWADGLEKVAENLSSQYPEFEQEIKRKDTLYLSKVRAQGEKMKAEIQQIPEEKRVLITSHDAFHYFGIAFDVEVQALQGVSTVAEPGIRKVEDLAEFIIHYNIPSVFVESSVSSKSMKALRQACGRNGHELAEGGTLYSDAMGDKESGADTYLKMLQSNTKTLVNGLK